MNDIITYITGVVACSAVFTLFYRTAMHRRTSFRTARVYLLASLALAAVIPALDIPVWSVPPIEVPFVPQIPATSVNYTPAVPATDWTGIALWTLWGAGIALLTAMMARQAARIARIRRSAERFSTGGCEIALSGEIDAPFSFLDTVFIERGTSENDVRQIVLHEGSHIRHRHSQEKIAAETLKTLMWFNPFAWWTASLLGEVHEFEADRDVLDGGATVEEYLPLIFRQIFGYVPELSVGLGDSLTKKRLLMMKTNMKLTKFGWLRVAGVLPLAAGLVLLFSFTSRQPEITYTEAPAAAAQEPQKGGDVPTYTSEVMPVPPGGDVKAFRNWAASQIVYPGAAQKAGISGRVTLRFVVERDGSLSGLEALESPDQSLTDEAIRVLRLSPKWTPGTLGGNPARVFYVLPVNFALAPASGSAATPAGEIAVVGYGTQRRDNPASAMEAFDSFIKVDGETLRFLDGKQITKEQMDTLAPDTIESMSVLKDATATEHYGEAGKDGVILITSKSAGTTASAETNELQVVGYGTQRRDNPASAMEAFDSFIKVDGETLRFLDGKQITKEQMDTLAPDTIESISVLKDASAIETYGEAGKDGVILITSKSAK